MRLESWWLWTPDAGPAVVQLRRGMVFLFGLVTLALAGVLATGAARGNATGSWRLAEVLLPIVCAAVGIAATLGHLGPLELTAVVLLAEVAYLVPDPTGSAMPVGAIHATSVAVVAVTLTLRRRVAIPVGVAVTASTTATGSLILSDPGIFLVDLAVLNIGMIVAGTALVASLVAAMHEVDVNSAIADAAEVEASRREHEEDSIERARGTVHNKVIYALEAIARGVDPPQAQHSAQGALTALADQPLRPEADFEPHQWARRILQDAPLPLAITVEVAERRCEVPTKVAEALREAVGEAIRNAEKHTTVEKVDLSVRVDEEGLSAAVSDRGPGLDARHAAPATSGVDEIIRGPVTRVGGTADITSSAAGTTVTVSWRTAHAEPDGASDPLAASYARTLRSPDEATLFSKVGWPLLVTQAVLATHYSSVSEHAPAMLGLALVLALSLAAVTRRMERGPRPGRELVFWSAVLASAEVIGFRIQGIESAADFRSWFVGFACMPLIVLAFTATWRWLLVLTLPAALAVWVWVGLDPDVSVARAAGCLLSHLTVVVAWAVGERMRRARDSSEHERRRALTAELSADLDAALRRANDLYLGYARGEIQEWLERVVAEPTVLDDPAVRATARRLADHAQDELDLPGVLDPVVRRRIGRFRERGGTVTLQHPGVTTMDTRLGVRLLDRAIDQAARNATITLSLGPDDGWSRLSVAPPLPDGGRALLPALDEVPSSVREYPGLLQVRFANTPPVGNVAIDPERVERTHA